MEVKEVDRVVIAKPVASRPTCSSFKSFSQLLAGAIDDSPSPANGCSEMAVTAIKPKTVRVKPAINHSSVDMISQAEASGAGAGSYEYVYKLENKSNVIFKPLAKVVSRRTVSLLASMVSSNIFRQDEQGQVDACAQHLNQNTLHLVRDPPQAEPSRSVEAVELPKIAQQMVGEESKIMASSSANVDRPSYDGYNWRKYGQKQVKGSEHPRSYYKCTYPNCPVKKMVERSSDGHIAEIVYKGEHNHPKPLPPKRSASGVQRQGLATDGTVQDHNSVVPKLCDNICARNEGLEGQMENQNAARFSNQSTPEKSPIICQDPAKMDKHNSRGVTYEDSAGHSGNIEDRINGLEGDDNEPKSKRRKNDDENGEAGPLGEGVQEPRISVQNNTEPEIMADGFRWRKYGQKVVKGNPYPRSYYRCTNLKCNVRKHVERASDDPRAFITTYEGKHNHEMPIKNSIHSSELGSKAPTTLEKQ